MTNLGNRWERWQIVHQFEVLTILFGGFVFHDVGNRFTSHLDQQLQIQIVRSLEMQMPVMKISSDEEGAEGSRTSMIPRRIS